MISLIMCLIGLITMLIIFIYSSRPFSKKAKGILIGGGVVFCISIGPFLAPFFITFSSVPLALQQINKQENDNIVIYGKCSALAIAFNNEGKIIQSGFTFSSNNWKISNPHLGTNCIGKSYPIENCVGFVTQIPGDNGIYIVLFGIDLPKENIKTIADTNNSNFQNHRDGMHFIVGTYIPEIKDEYTIYINGRKADITPLRNEMNRTIKYNYSQFYTFLLNGILIVVAVALVTRKMLKNKKRKGSQENVNYNNIRD